MVQAGRMVACGTLQAGSADPATVHRLAGLLKSCSSPNRALKLTLFALLERYSTFDRLDLDEMHSKAPTPSGADDEIMDAISRVRIDGKAVLRTERTIDKGEAFLRAALPVLGDRLPRRAEDRLPGPDPAHAADWSVCWRPTTSATDPPRRASTRRPSTGWPHPSRSSNRRNRCTDRTHRAERETHPAGHETPTHRAAGRSPSRTSSPHAPSSPRLPSRSRPGMILTTTSHIEGMRHPAAPRHPERQGHHRRQHLQGLLRIDTRGRHGRSAACDKP